MDSSELVTLRAAVLGRKEVIPKMDWTVSRKWLCSARVVEGDPEVRLTAQVQSGDVTSYASSYICGKVKKITKESGVSVS